MTSNMNQIPEVLKTDDLFYVCSLIEYIGRERKLRRTFEEYLALPEPKTHQKEPR